MKQQLKLLVVWVILALVLSLYLRYHHEVNSLFRKPDTFTVVRSVIERRTIGESTYWTQILDHKEQWYLIHEITQVVYYAAGAGTLDLKVIETNFFYQIIPTNEPGAVSFTVTTSTSGNAGRQVTWPDARQLTNSATVGNTIIVKP